ncbi:monooxygenase [Elasticomyces elasticus]|nr:monooxygenase [Elasticomyces elasticus]
MPSSNGMRVTVIGAGASGLAAAKYLLAEGFVVTVFERKANVGGVWNTAPGNGPYPAPVYEGLETNVARTLMTLSDHPWPKDASLFPRSEVVGAYLQSYAAAIQSTEFAAENLTMRLYTNVLDVRRSSHLYTEYWRVTASKRTLGKDEAQTVEYFHGVVVALGVYHEPHMPKQYNVDEWCQAYPGSLIHAVDFCRPEHFRNKTVLVVGNSASGWDISLQLKNVAKMVIVSSGRWKAGATLSAPSHIGVKGIQSWDVSARSVTFTDGRTAYGVDNIILCTGYVYDFSFLRKGTQSLCGDEKLFETGLRVADVYKHIFYIHDPTLAFVGLPKKTAAFTVAEAQSAVVARAFAGRILRPSKPALERWVREANETWKKDLADGKVGASDYHSFNLALDKDYVNDLHDWSMRVIKSTMFEDDGQSPPYWCHCLDRARKESGKMRRAFLEKKDRRHEYTTHQSLGGSLPASCDHGVTVTSQANKAGGHSRSCYLQTYAV